MQRTAQKNILACGREGRVPMSIMSPMYFLLLGILILIYYRLSQKNQWKLLLAGSLIFVASYNVKFLIFLVISAWSIWAAGRKLEAVQTSGGTGEKQGKRAGRRILLLTVGVNLGILIALKYCAPWVRRELMGLESPLGIFIPLGISYYTLQAISYVMDVYWGRIRAEASFLKLLLYLSYFPQILQGPISRYGDLSRELFEKEHLLDMRNLKHGVQRILWGMVQMTVFADFLAAELPAVSTQFYGLAMFVGLALFGLQLYCNFSGGIDLILGVSQCFGITLPENFRQPFFSKSLGEFWRRWHMTLGAWMKDYVFFPLSMSHGASRLKKSLKKRVSRKTANRIVMAGADVIVFLLVGIWHGTGLNYAIWGLYNGLILAFSELMADRYQKAKTGLHIDVRSRWWQGFCLMRTFVVVTLGWSTDCAATALGTWELIRNLFLLQKTNLGLYSIGAFHLLVLAFILVTMLVVGILREKGHSVRDLLDRAPFWVQVLFWVAVIQVIGLMGKYGASGGLMYANF